MRAKCSEDRSPEELHKGLADSKSLKTAKDLGSAEKGRGDGGVEATEDEGL